MLLNDYYAHSAHADDHQREINHFIATRRLTILASSHQLQPRWQRRWQRMALYRLGSLLIASGTRLKTAAGQSVEQPDFQPSSVHI